MVGSLLILGFGFITLAVFEQFLIDSEDRLEFAPVKEQRPNLRSVK